MYCDSTYMHRFVCSPCVLLQRWVTGAVFVPDSAGYLLAASLLGGAARRLGAERVALAGQLAVALAALAVPHANSVSIHTNNLQIHNQPTRCSYCWDTDTWKEASVRRHSYVR